MESRSGSKRWDDEVESRVQRRMVAEYRQGVRGYEYIAAAKRLQLPVSTVKGVVGAERAGGDPVAQTQEEKAEQWGGGKVVQGS